MTLETQQQALTQAQQELEIQRQRVQQARQQASKIKIPRRSLEFQQQYVRTGKIPIGRVEQHIAKMRREKSSRFGQVSQAESQIQSRQQEIDRVQAEINSARAEEASYNRVMEMINRKARGQRIAYANLTDDERKLYQKIANEPSVREALNRGAGIAIGARASGMNPLEYSQIQGALVGRELPSAKVIGVSTSVFPTINEEKEKLKSIQAIEGATYKEEFLGSTISPTQELTSEQRYNLKKYSELYGGEEGKVKKFIKKVASNIFGTGPSQKTESQLFTEVITPVQVGTFGGRGTSITRNKTASELSEEAQLYSFGLGKQFESGLAIESKKQKILDIISPGGITEQEAREANIALGNISAFEGSKISASLSTEQKRISEVGAIKFLPEWKPNISKQEDWLYGKGVPVKEIKKALAWESFGVGLYEGIRKQPKKALVSAGIAIGTTALTWGIGTPAVAGALGYARYAKTIGTGIKAFGIGAGTLYGGSVAGRLYFAEGGLYGKSKAFGEITSTELLPGMLGYKLGTYGIRRGGLYYERSQVLKGLSTELKGAKFSDKEIANIQKEFLLSKAFQNVKTPVKELDFAGMKRIPVKARQPLLDFLNKRSLVVGGSLSSRAQLLTKEVRAPGDVDIFVRGPFAEMRSKWYAESLFGKLKKAGVKAKLKGASIKIKGEKAIEFHSFKEYMGANIEQVIPLWRTARSGITRTPSGIRVLKIGTQGSMKVLGYARHGAPRTKDIRDWGMAIRPTLTKQLTTELGPKLKYVDYIKAKGVPKEIRIEGAVTRKGPFALSGIEKVEILKGAEKGTLTHELVHVAKPLWSEKKVGQATVMSDLVGKQGFLARRTPAKVRTPITYYKTSQATTPFIYPRKAERDYVKTPKVKAFGVPYLPTKPTAKPSMFPQPKSQYSPYKPKKFTAPYSPLRTSTGHYKPFLPTTRPVTIPRTSFITRKEKPGERTVKIKLPKFAEKGKKKAPKPRRQERYTPSLSATILGIRARARPTKVLGNSYFSGIRPIITSKRRFKRRRRLS